MAEFLYHKQTCEEIAERVDPQTVVVIPTGSVEQHGMHLPLETDSRIAEAIARRAAERASKKIDVLVTPTVWTGYSNHHLDFPGTLSLNMDTFINVAIDLAMSLVHHRFKKLVFLNAHGGNSVPLQAAVNQIRDRTQGDVLVAAVDYFDLLREELAGVKDSHAGEMETSCMLYLEGQWVRKDRMSRFTPQWRSSPYFSIGWWHPPSKVHLGFHIKDFSKTGVYGDPNEASPEKGQRFIERAAKKVGEFLVDFSKWEFSNLFEIED